MLDPVQFKRQIIEDSERNGFRKKLVEDHAAGRNTELTVEMGAALESLTQHKGWAYVEQYMFARTNPVKVIMDAIPPEEKYRAQAFIQLMQYIAAVVKAKNEIIASQNKSADTAA